MATVEGINEAAVARGTNRDAVAVVAGADARWNELPGGATPWDRELVTKDGSPSLAMDMLSDDRGGKMTTEFRRPSAVKSVQSQYQPEQLHARMAFFGGTYMSQVAQTHHGCDGLEFPPQESSDSG